MVVFGFEDRFYGALITLIISFGPKLDFFSGAFDVVSHG
jgi:hypothetical protein